MAELAANILSTWVDWDIDLASRPEVVQPLVGGSSHRSYLVSGLTAQGSSRLLVVRVENTQSRQLAMPANQEAAIMRRAQQLAPAIVFRNSQALVTNYIEAPHWQPAESIPIIANGLRELHFLQAPHGLQGFNLIAHCDAYWDKLGGPKQHQSTYQMCRQQLQSALLSYPQQCLCHNDLQPGNMLLDKGRLVLLDWEYAALNSAYFDIASLAEYGQLEQPALQQFCLHYWKSPAAGQHLVAINAFRPIVRLLEWLWLSLQGQSAPAQQSLQRLLQLL